MSTKQRRGVRRSESEWREIVDQLQRSSESQVAFSKRLGISVSTLQSWQRKLVTRRAPAEFIDVTPAARPATPWSIEIAFPDGTMARVRG